MKPCGLWELTPGPQLPPTCLFPLLIYLCPFARFRPQSVSHSDSMSPQGKSRKLGRAQDP